MSRPRLPGVLLVLVVVVSAASAGLSLTRPGSVAAGLAAPGPDRDGVYRPADFAGPSGPGLAAAVRMVPAALSYDYRHLARSRRAATSHMSADLAARYRREFSRLTEPFVRHREVVDATVSGAGVVRADAGHVICLLLVDQRLADLPGDDNDRPGVVAQVRVVADLARHGDRWVIDDLAPVG